MPSPPCPPCKYPNPCVCDEAIRLQEEIEKRGSYPFVRQMECRYCHKMRRFMFSGAARRDKSGAMWGWYRDALGHEDYIPLTAQSFGALTSHSEAPPEQQGLEL